MRGAAWAEVLQENGGIRAGLPEIMYIYRQQNLGKALIHCKKYLILLRESGKMYNFNVRIGLYCIANNMLS